MMKVFWEEWRGSRSFSVRQALPVWALLGTAGLAISKVQPGVFFEVLALGFLFAGLWSGTQRWNEVHSWDWVHREGIGPVGYAAGKVAGFLFAQVLWCLVLAPPVVLVVLVWGLPWELVVQVSVWALAGGLAAQALGHLTTWTPMDFSRLLAGLLLAAWLVSTLQMKELNGLNPLWQIWRLHREAGADPQWGSLGALGAGTAAVWAAILVFLRGQRRSRP